jgi:hypothetical protein
MKDFAIHLLHRMSHMLGQNRGDVTAWFQGYGKHRRLMVGYQCRECGKITGIHESYTEARKGAT